MQDSKVKTETQRNGGYINRFKQLEQRLDRLEARMTEKFRKIGEHLAIPELTV